MVRRRGELSRPRLVTAGASCLYLVAVLAVTLLPLNGPKADTLILVPLITIDPVNFLLNIVMTVPLGFLLPLLTRVRGAGQVAWLGLAASTAIEVTQFVTDALLHSGRTSDVNDLIANTLGAVAGYLLWRRVAARTERFSFVRTPVRTSR